MDNMAFQISFGQHTRRLSRHSRRAFTLVEVMIAAGLSTMILAGVLSTFLMMGRVGANVVNYTDIEAQARTALEQFSREVRMAFDVSSYSDTSVTLKIPDTTANPTGLAYSVTYAYDSANKQLTRDGIQLITDIVAIPGTPVFTYYRRIRTGYVDGYTTNDVLNATEIKQLEVSFSLQKKNVTVTTASNKVLSARFILRNK
jgi:type II secretory pathway pseudopilin PulG